MPDGNGPATLPEAKPITGAVGLGGLIQRRVEVGQEDAGLVQTEAYPEYEKHEEEARAGREAAQRVQRESAELTAKATQHFDRGMLYETLRLGLPTPSADAVETKRRFRNSTTPNPLSHRRADRRTCAAGHKRRANARSEKAETAQDDDAT